MSKKIKIFLYIIVGLLVLPLILSYGFLDPYLQKQINKKIENASKGLYSITYSSLHYNLYTLTIHLSDIKITPDGTKLDHIKVKKLVKFKVKSINIKFTKFYSLLFKHHLYFNSIRLDNPFFRVVNLPFKKSTLHLSLQLKQLKSLFKIKHIELNDGAFINYDFIHNKVLSSIQNFSFKARNVSIPSSFKIKDVRFQGLNLKLSNFVAVYDSLHSLEIKKIKISQALKVTEVEGFNYSPRISKYQLCKTYGKSISWNHLLIPQMSFIDLNLDSAKNRKLIARKIYLTKPLYENFSDKKYPKDSVKTIYILSSLQNSDFKFHIDTLNIYKGDIVIETLNKKSRLPNQLFLSEIKGNITDVWISKDSADEKTSIKTKLKGYFQKVVPFTLESYPAHYPNNWVHQGQAHITGFNLKYIKKYLKSNYGIRVDSGKCTDLNFKFKVNKKRLKGELCFQYQNLKFDYLQKEGNKSLPLLFSQKMGIFNKSNPLKKGKIRTVRVDLAINPRESLIYNWKSGVEQGIVKSVIPVKKWKN